MNKAEKQQYIENLDQMSKDYSAFLLHLFTDVSKRNDRVSN